MANGLNSPPEAQKGPGVMEEVVPSLSFHLMGV